MDPYLEPHWLDVHHALITYSRDELQPSLPGDLIARMEERVFVEAENSPQRGVDPDVRVVEDNRFGRRAATPSESAVAQPIVIEIADEPITQGFIQIIDSSSGGRVVTVIDFLSPSNKVPGEGQDLYLQKQQELKASRTNLVEIDLTRAGKRVLAVPLARVPPSHRTTYQVCVRRGSKPRHFEVYRFPLGDRLPAIRIPLRETDADVALDLQGLIDQCYRTGRYDRIDYSAELTPSLDPEDAAWADELLRGRGLRR
jgi:hypothetical protein